MIPPPLSRQHAMSLVEVCIAIGVFSFCVLAVFGLLPTGVSLLQDTRSETVATNVLTGLVSDIRSTPEGQTISPRYRMPLDATSSGEAYFDLNGNSLPTASDAFYRSTWSIAVRNPTNVTPARALVSVAWPASAARPTGQIEMLVLFNKP
jgi:uncharacterized protein (TIGR02598 family)